MHSLKRPNLWTSRRLAQLKRRAGRFVAARRGATAVEFALIALPLFVLLFGIIELGVIYVLSTSLDNATATVSRTIRTGQIADSEYNSAAGFREEICNRMGWVASDCLANLAIEVRTMDSYALPAAPVIDETFNQNLGWDAGLTQESKIVLVRAFYRWKVLTPLLSKGLATGTDGTRMVNSTIVFRNEPFGS